MENEQAGVNGTWSFHVHIINVINGLVEGSVGIQVLAKLHTDGLEVLLQVVTREVGGAVEAHVFEEVCQTTLVFLFLDGAHLLGNVKECTFLWPLIMTQIISQSIGQHTFAYCRIHRHRGVLRRCRN